MRPPLVVLCSAFAVVVSGRAAAQDAGTPPAPVPPAPPAPSASTPEPAPAKAVTPKEVAPSNVTLQEEEEEPLPPIPGAGTAATKKPKKHKLPPKTHAAEPEPVEAPPPEARERPTQSAEAKPKPASDENPEGDEGKSKKDEGDGVFGPFRIGVLVGTGLPGILNFGGIIKLTRYFGAGINIGLIPTIRLAYYGEADISYQEYDVYARIFPFGGALFAGAGVGYERAEGSVSASYPIPAFPGEPAGFPTSLAASSDGSVRVLVLTPMIGLLHTFGSGFTIGVDAGAQIPIAPSESHVDIVVPTQGLPPQIVNQYIYPNLVAGNQKVQDTLDTVGRTILPTLNLRIGWLL